jgi:hypothetical protein
LPLRENSFSMFQNGRIHKLGVDSLQVKMTQFRFLRDSIFYSILMHLLCSNL